MAFRVGLLDIGAAGVVLVAILLPAPTKPIHPIYEGSAAAFGPEIAVAQADVARKPGDRQALKRLVDLLVLSGQSDWALRVAGDAAVRAETCEKWWPTFLVSVAHADRLEVKPAWEWAEKALAACEAQGCTSCGVDWRVRLQVFADKLKAGVESGIDPRENPDAFKQAVDRAVPMIRVGPKRGR